MLIEFLDTEIKPKSDYVRGNQCTKVSLTDIWYLFRPGDEVIDQRKKQVYRIIGVSSSAHKAISPWRHFSYNVVKSDETPIKLHCVYVDFDGKHLGPVLKIFEIPRFEGEKPITSLTVYPLRLEEAPPIGNPGLSSSQTFREELIARGRLFTEVLSVKHMHYNGLTLDMKDEVDGQVMIDFEESFATEAKKSNPDAGEENRRPSIQSLTGTVLHETEDIECDADCCRGENVHKDTYAEKKRNEDYVNSLIPDEPSHRPTVMIFPRALADLNSPDYARIDDDYVIMSYRVFGFILRSRKWGK